MRQRHGWCIVDLLVSMMSIGVALAVVVPVLAQLGGLSQIEVSASNLQTLSQATVMYAADWNGRQYTNINDDLTSYGNNPNTAMASFLAENDEHPALLLGWGSGGALWGYYLSYPGNYRLYQPIDFGLRFGLFRIINSAQFHQYVNGRFADPTFYAPGDTAAYEAAEPLFDEPYEFVSGDSGSSALFWSSYCFSPAAMFNPVVMGANRDGVFVDPFSLPDGLTSPSLDASAYPDLKTHILEHNWVQNPPGTCNPAFPGFGTYNGCEPYYFNQGLDSAPMTLFYDGHIRLLPNEEAMLADQTVLQQSGGVNGLWQRGTPLGTDGYFIESGYDGTPLSHHILTTSGILGRDVLNMSGGTAESPRIETADKFHRPQILARIPGASFIFSAEP